MAPNIPDFDAAGRAVVKPASLAHVVLRTNNFQKMIDFYVTFLGGHITFSNEFMAFITYDEEHHRIALLGFPDTAPKKWGSAGLEHVAFTFSEMADLLLAYRQRKNNGILPNWCVNHGPTTSLYYQDPDGNTLETQVDNCSADEATKFMHSPEFAKNPIGIVIDPEDLIRRLREGESDASLKRRNEEGEVAVVRADGQY